MRSQFNAGCFTDYYRQMKKNDTCRPQSYQNNYDYGCGGDYGYGGGGYQGYAYQDPFKGFGAGGRYPWTPCTDQTDRCFSPISPSPLFNGGLTRFFKEFQPVRPSDGGYGQGQDYGYGGGYDDYGSGVAQPAVTPIPITIATLQMTPDTVTPDMVIMGTGMRAMVTPMVPMTTADMAACHTPMPMVQTIPMTTAMQATKILAMVAIHTPQAKADTMPLCKSGLAATKRRN